MCTFVHTSIVYTKDESQTINITKVRLIKTSKVNLVFVLKYTNLYYLKHLWSCCPSEEDCSSTVCQCLNWNQVSLAGSGLLGQREVTEGEHGGPHACTVLKAPVVNTFFFVTQSHVSHKEKQTVIAENRFI